MQIYIDESGNLGKKTRFFVLASLIPNKPKRIKNIIKRSCVKFGSGDSILDEIKASCLSFPEKQNILMKLNKKDDFTCSYIVADKKYIIPEILQDKNICYNYLAYHLLRPIIRGVDDDIQVILDNHTIKVSSINSLSDYIKIEAYTKWGFKKNITFEYHDSKEYKNLQAIDVIANTIYGRYNYNAQHLYNLLNTKFIHCIKFPYKKFNT
jgi:hypothetical protein